MRKETVHYKRSSRAGRKALALLLSCLMAFTALPIPAGAVEEPGGHVHDETCGYVEGDPDSCNQGAPQPDNGIEPEGGTEPNDGIEPDKCTCETQCTEGQIDPDCPVCSADDADLSLCTGAPPARRGTSRTGTTIEVDGTSTTLASAVQSASDGNTLQITAGITLTSGVTIDSKNLTLDLNGQTVTSTVTGTNTGAITLTGTASLTVTDTSTGKNGKLEVTSTTGIAIRNESSGEVKVEGGTVTTSGGSSSYAICNSSTGTVNVTGGTVEATGSGGRAIHNNGAGTITVSDNAEVSATDSSGRAIHNNSGGTITVSGNAAVSATGSSGYAIYNYSTGEVKVEGGEVSATTGNAICNEAGGTITVTGGKVKATGANSAIYNFSTGSLNISGGTVEATASNGRAIYNNSTGKITVSGNATVTSANTSDTSGTIHLVKVPSAAAVVLEITGGTVENTANPAGYAVYFYPTSVNTDNLSNYYKHTSGTVGKVYPAPPVVEITSGGNTTLYTTLAAAITAAQATGDTLKVIDDIDLGNTGVEITNGKALTLDLNGHTITYNGSGSAISLSGDTSAGLTVEDSSSGGKLEVTGGYAIYNYGGGTVKIEGGTVTSKVTAINNDSTGTVEVSGGTVSSPNQAINNVAAGTVIVSGGTVTASGSGGSAIYNARGTITVSGSAEVTATSGIAIRNDSTGTVEVSGGTVSATTGKAIYNASTGAVTISDNAAVKATTGQAIYNNAAGEVKVSGGTVSATDGTAIYNFSTGKITISGTAKVTSANASGNSGTIYLNAVPSDAAVVLEIKDTATVENTATDGYAVYFVPASVTYANLSDYYTEAEGAQVGRVYPEAPAAVELWRNGSKVDPNGEFDTLAAAIQNAQTGDKLVINKPIDLGTTGVEISGKALTLDLNGQTVTYSGTGSAISLSGDTNTGLTVMDSSSGQTGKLEATSGDYSGVIANTSTGTVTVASGTVSGSNQCDTAIGNSSTGTVSVTGGTVSVATAIGSAIYNGGGGAINVSGGTVSATGSNGDAIYNNVTGAVNVSGGTVSAIGGKAIFNVSTGKITISGTAEVTSANTSTYSGTIYLNAVPSGIDNLVVLEIKDSAQVKNTANPADYAVYFNTNTTSVTAANLSTYYTKTGGTVGWVYPAAVELLGSDDAFKGSYVTLDEAIGAAATGDKLKVIADINLGETGVDINGKALTLDLNGHTVSHSGSNSASAAIELKNSANTGLTVTDSSSGQTGTLEAVNIAINNVSTGTVTVTGGTVSSTGANGTAISGSTKVTGGTVTASNYAIASEGAVTVEGGTVTATGANGRAIYSSKVTGTVNISGGTVSADGTGGTAIHKGDSAGKVTISGSATVTSANTSNTSGTISLGPVQPSSSNITALEITGGTVKNTAGGNAVYNGFAGAINISGGTLETDSATGKTINNASTGVVTISGGAVKNTANGQAIYNAGTVNITGGTVEATGVSGIAIWNTTNGKVTISGTAEVTSANTSANEGTIRFNETTDSTAVVLEITGGTVKNTASGNAVYNSAIGKINISGGTVSATTGNAIHNKSSGAVNISSGEVTADGTDGKAIYNDTTGTVNVSDGAVKATGEKGVAIYNNSTGEVIVNGGAVTVSGGTVESTGKDGRAIFNGGALTVTNGTVQATGENANAITSVGAVTVSGGTVSATGTLGYAISSVGSVTVSGGTVESTSSCAIYNVSTAKITISGSAEVTSANTDSTSGTIYLQSVPTGSTDLVVLDIKDTAQVTNTATPTAGYAVYFNTDGTGVNSDNVISYYAVATGAQVGKIYPTPPVMPTVEVNQSGNQHTVYANGTALIIDGTSATSTTIYVDMNGNGVIDNGVDKSLKKLNIAGAPDDGSDLRSCKIYGGSKENALTGSPKITMTGGAVLNIFGGGKGTGGDVTGDPAITITGGNPGDIYGGGSDGGTVTGSPKIAVTGGKASFVYGGGWEADLTGNPVIELTGGEAGTVYGGGSRTGNGSGGNVTGNTSVTVESSAKVGGTVYGGGQDGTVSGKATVNFNSPQYTGVTIFGGGSGQTTTVGSTEVILGASGKARGVSGGGSGGSKVTGTAQITVQGTTLDVYGVSGSGSGSTVEGTITVKVDGAAKVHNNNNWSGLWINGGTAPETKGVSSFVIGDLQADAMIYVVLPAGYTTGVIATEAVEADLGKLKLIGSGATDKLLRFDAAKGEIYVVDAPAAAYTTNGGTSWTECDSLSDALTAMATASNAATHRVRLLRNADTALEIQSGTFTLDLNGHQLAPDEGTATVTVGKRAALTLTDGVGGGKLVGAKKKAAGSAMAGVGVSVEGSLTVTGGKPFTIQGGGSNLITGESAIALKTGSSLQVSGTGAIRVQGGDGLGTNRGASAIDAKNATILCDNPNAVYQGGDSKGTSGQNGGSGLLANTGIDAIIRGGTFIGGKGGDNTATGGDGGDGIRVSISNTSVARSLVVDGATCIGGAGGSEATYPGHRGDGLYVDGADVTINGGVFEGRYGCWLANSAQATANQWTITGGFFNGDSIGLYVDANANSSLVVSVTGGTFTGDKYALTSTRANILKGGTFIANGESAYAIKGYNSILTGQMLTAGMAYFDASGTQITTGLDAYQLGQGATIQVAPATSKPDPVYNITGTVYEYGGQNPAQNASVTLKLGAEVVSRTTTNEQGQYTFPSVKPGLYNVVAQKDKLTMTILVQLTNSDADNQTIILPDGAKNSEVEVAQNTRPVIVGGVEQIAAAQEKPSTGESVTIKLTVEAKTEHEHKEEIISVAGDKTLEYLDVTLTRIKTSAAGAVNEENLGESNSQVLELVLPYVFEGKKNVTVYRKHGNDPAVALTQNQSKTDGTFWADTENGYLHIYASKFSTYAVGYTRISTGGGSTAHTLTASAGDGGSISPSGAVSVPQGGSQTFSVTPHSGYALRDVLVDGRSVGAVTSYTFENVTEDHSISAVFKPSWNPFTDVTESDWFYGAVRHAYEQNWMLGTSNTTFSPELSTQRGMIVTILWRMEGQPEAAGVRDFTDVEEGRYYTEAVAWADKNGIAMGYGNNKFGPSDPVTREQLAAILYRYAQYKGMDVSVKGELSGFTDAGKASAYAREPLGWAVGQGILNGKGGGILDPRGQATRAETAAMLQRFRQETAN
ncbi:S-layer homology domain-containing protein [Neglectibacter timonensis]|uniref:S-layer homology domain-containing protein n=1 Tax=Neglectibacter timonensis TaxID=1776382 RepID=UPI003219D1B0